MTALEFIGAAAIGIVGLAAIPYILVFFLIVLVALFGIMVCIIEVFKDNHGK